MVSGQAATWSSARHAPGTLSPAARSTPARRRQHLQDIRVGPEPWIVAIGGDEGGGIEDLHGARGAQANAAAWVPALGPSVSQTPERRASPPAESARPAGRARSPASGASVGLGGGNHRLPFGVNGAALFQDRLLLAGAGCLGLLFQPPNASAKLPASSAWLCAVMVPTAASQSEAASPKAAMSSSRASAGSSPARRRPRPGNRRPAPGWRRARARRARRRRRRAHRRWGGGSTRSTAPGIGRAALLEGAQDAVLAPQRDGEEGAGLAVAHPVEARRGLVLMDGQSGAASARRHAGRVVRSLGLRHLLSQVRARLRRPPPSSAVVGLGQVAGPQVKGWGVMVIARTPRHAESLCSPPRRGTGRLLRVRQ